MVRRRRGKRVEVATIYFSVVVLMRAKSGRRGDVCVDPFITK